MLAFLLSFVVIVVDSMHYSGKAVNKRQTRLEATRSPPIRSA